jgi:hypothetical protein
VKKLIGTFSDLTVILLLNDKSIPSMKKFEVLLEEIMQEDMRFHKEFFYQKVICSPPKF